jgi:beta-barrel assembly-enhancing protease
VALADERASNSEHKLQPTPARQFPTLLCGCALASQAVARVLPSSLEPLVKAGYRPVDSDERGLWLACEELEKNISSSSLLIRDQALKSYLQGVVRELLGETASDLRLYVVRHPEFNASMAPNGMMLVHTGLLARARNEAQLAAVLAHEAGHYLRLHALRRWRDLKTKTAIVAAMEIGSGIATAKTGVRWYDLSDTLVNNTLQLSLLSFSRETESEADAYGLRLLNDARYPPLAAAEVWAQFIAERAASASERNRRYSGEGFAAFSTHLPPADRMRDLAESATQLESSSDSGDRDLTVAWQSVIAPFRSMLLEEQIKLNDPGASLYLLDSLAQDGWNGLLRYYEGEVFRLRGEAGDAERAGKAYSAAVRFADAPPEAFRAHGYALLKSKNVEQGRRALQRYLELKPDAPDAQMVRFTLGGLG